MFEIIKDPTFAERNIPLGILEVTYPDRSAWDITKFYDLVHAELDALREKYADYDRKAVFGENLYFRFFKKFKKTYPVMQQFESVMFKGRPFPEEDPVMGCRSWVCAPQARIPTRRTSADAITRVSFSA